MRKIPKWTYTVFLIGAGVFGSSLLSLPEHHREDYQVTALTVRESERLGPFMVDQDGRTLYIFIADPQGEEISNCYEECARYWPPALAAPGAILLPDGAPPAGRFERETGATQLTYDGWPLYYYVGDLAPGQASGHLREEFGGEWHLIGPTGIVLP